MTKKQITTVDITPTWSGLLPTLLCLYTEGSPKGRAYAEEELQRMAILADAYVKEHKR